MGVQELWALAQPQGLLIAAFSRCSPCCPFMHRPVASFSCCCSCRGGGAGGHAGVRGPPAFPASTRHLLQPSLPGLACPPTHACLSRPLSLCILAWTPALAQFPAAASLPLRPPPPLLPWPTHGRPHLSNTFKHLDGRICKTESSMCSGSTLGWVGDATVQAGQEHYEIARARQGGIAIHGARLGYRLHSIC